MAIDFSECFWRLFLQIESIVRRARASYAVYCSSLTGLPLKLSLVVPAQNFSSWLYCPGAVARTSEHDNGASLGTSYTVHSASDIQMMMSQGNVAATLLDLAVLKIHAGPELLSRSRGEDFGIVAGSRRKKHGNLTAESPSQNRINLV